jgi:DNA-binding MarR family transcriptional regulator
MDMVRRIALALARVNPRLLDQGGLQRLIGYNLRRAEVQMRGRVAQVLGEDDIRAVEYSILCLIGDNAEVTQKDLGEALAVKRPNMVSLIERLEARGLIVRAVMERDRRNHALSLTPAGEQLRRHLDERLDALEAEVFGGWSTAERAQLITLLRRVAAA